MLKRLSAVCLAVLLLLAPVSSITQAAATVDYTYHIDWMQQVGLVVGNNQGLNLDATITRAEMAAFLQRALGWSAPTEPVIIADVAVTNWAYAPLQAAIANGALQLDQGNAQPTVKLGSTEAATIAQAVGITLNLAPAAELSRGQLLSALGEAVSETLTVIHTNDSHGRILADDENGILGWERVATVIDQTRQANPDTLVLDAGDAFHGTNEAQFFDGASVVDLMNAAGVEVMVPGNHDFNYGQERLLELAEQAEFDIVNANIHQGEDTLLPAYVVRELAGMEIAVFGLTSQDTPVLTHPKNVVGLEFQDPIATAQELIAELPSEVDLVIALTHLGYDVDKQLAQAVPEIDLIIGGHSHTELLAAEKVNDTYIAQAGEHTKYVGRENLIFYQDQLVDVVSDPVPYSADIAKFPAASALAEQISAQVEEEMQAVIGEAATDLDGVREHVRAQETDLGNIIADVMRQSTGADVAVTNGGGIRDSISAGPITVKQIKTVLPFGNTLCTIQLTGEQLLSVLEHSVRLYPETNGGFLQVSGLTFSFDPSKPACERVAEVLVNGAPLDPEAIYTVATNDFTAAGGDGFDAFTLGTNLVNTGIALDDVLIEHIQENGSLSGSVEGRITAIAE